MHQSEKGSGCVETKTWLFLAAYLPAPESKATAVWAHGILEPLLTGVGTWQAVWAEQPGFFGQAVNNSESDGGGHGSRRTPVRCFSLTLRVQHHPELKINGLYWRHICMSQRVPYMSHAEPPLGLLRLLAWPKIAPHTPHHPPSTVGCFPSRGTM